MQLCTDKQDFLLIYWKTFPSMPTALQTEDIRSSLSPGAFEQILHVSVL